MYCSCQISFMFCSWCSSSSFTIFLMMLQVDSLRHWRLWVYFFSYVFIRLYVYLRDLSSLASMLIVCIHSLVWKCFYLPGDGWCGCWFIWELLRFYHGNNAIPFRKQKHQIFCIKWNLFTFSKRQFLCQLLLYTTHYAL